MIPLILAAVGGYFIADSVKDKKVFANGGYTTSKSDRMLAPNNRLITLEQIGTIWTLSDEANMYDESLEFLKKPYISREAAETFIDKLKEIIDEQE